MLGLAALIGWSLTGPTLARAQGVCDRTPQVRDKLVEVTGASGCAAVTPELLEGVTRLDLSNAGIDRLQAGDFRGLSRLEDLFLNGNSLSSLPEGIFRGLSRLEWLSLSFNHITALPKGVFSGLGNLGWLELNGNSLNHLPEGIFSELHSLTWLLLASNSLNHVPEGIFRGLSRLYRLGLSHNHLTTLPEGVFEGLHSLTQLSLGHNALTTLPQGVCSDLSRLKWLELSYNHLTTLPDGVFQGLDNLRDLWLNGNRLTTLPAGIFSGLANLRELWLEGNRLASLPEGVFSGLDHLPVLRLQDNHLTSLTAGVFSELPNLRELWLQDNHLSSLPKGVFQGLDRLESLQLQGNGLVGLPAGIFDDLLDTLGRDPELPGLAVDPVLQARLGFAAVSQRAAPGSPVRVRVRLDRRLPLALWVPYRVKGSEADYSGLSPPPQEGLLFPAGETARDITLTLAEGGEVREKTLLLTLGDLSAMELRPSEGSGPRAAHLDTGTLASSPRGIAVHAIAISGPGDGPDTDSQGVCDHTPQVRDKLVAATGASDCASVSPERLERVTWLDLSEAGIERLQAGDFRGLRQLRWLFLHGNSLANLPEEVFQGLDSLKWLYLYENALTSLPEGVFQGLDSLERLSLYENALTDLPEGVFAGLGRLRSLLLSDNDLTFLPEGLFQGLRSLEALSLFGNSLSLLPEGVFAGLDRLRSLFLTNNEIVVLPDGLFQGLDSLKLLWLEGNSLSLLPEEVFADLDRLEVLFLSFNRISRLPPGVFSGLQALSQLRLYTNRLSSLPEGVFHGLGRLVLLNLNRNDLEAVPEGSFRGLSRLQHLSLGDNEIDRLPPNLFQGLDSLKQLTLYKLPLTTLPRGIFDDVLDTLGGDRDIPGTTFFPGPAGVLGIDDHLKAEAGFASPVQTAAEGSRVRVEVRLSRPLPVAVRVPYSIGVSGQRGGLSGLSPAPDRGLLFRAGETRRQIAFTLLPDPQIRQERRVELTLGHLTRIGLRRSDGSGPDAPLLKTRALLHHPRQEPVHTVTVSPVSRDHEPFCLSLWNGAPCADGATLPQVLLGPVGENQASAEVVLTHRDPRAATCEAALLFHRGTAPAPAVAFNGRFLDRNLFSFTLPRGGAEILTLTAPDATGPAAGALSLFTRAPCAADSLRLEVRTLIENPQQGNVEEMVALPAVSPPEWLGDGDCRVLTGVFGEGRPVELAVVAALPGQAAPPGARLRFRVFDLQGNFLARLPDLPVSGRYQALAPWKFQQPRMVRMCLEVPGTDSPFRLALTALGSSTSGGRVQYAPQRFPASSRPRSMPP